MVGRVCGPSPRKDFRKNSRGRVVTGPAHDLPVGCTTAAATSPAVVAHGAAGAFSSNAGACRTSQGVRLVAPGREGCVHPGHLDQSGRLPWPGHAAAAFLLPAAAASI